MVEMNGWKVRDKPPPPPRRVVRDGDVHERCVRCGSSQVWPLGWFGRLCGARPLGCLNPGCERYRA